MVDGTGRLVVKANPDIAILGTVDWMPCCTPIAAATISAGELTLDYGESGARDYPDGTMTVTRGGLTVYQDENGVEYTEAEVAILTESGDLIDLPGETGQPFLDVLAKSPADVLIREMMAHESEAFENDQPVNGADLVDWFAEFRAKVGAIMAAGPVGER